MVGPPAVASHAPERAERPPPAGLRTPPLIITREGTGVTGSSGPPHGPSDDNMLVRHQPIHTDGFAYASIPPVYLTPPVLKHKIHHEESSCSLLSIKRARSLCKKLRLRLLTKPHIRTELQARSKKTYLSGSERHQKRHGS